MTPSQAVAGVNDMGFLIRTPDHCGHAVAALHDAARVSSATVSGPPRAAIHRIGAGADADHARERIATAVGLIEYPGGGAVQGAAGIGPETAASCRHRSCPLGAPGPAPSCR